MAPWRLERRNAVVLKHKQSNGEFNVQIPDAKLRDRKRPSLVWILLVGTGLVGMYAALLIPALTGRNIDPTALGPYLLWTVVFFWLLWKRLHRKGWHGVLIGVGVAMACLFIADFAGAYARDHAPMDTQLARIAEQANRSPLRSVNSDLRFERAVAGPGLLLTYDYTLVHLRSTQIQPGAFETRFAVPFVKIACSNAAIESMLARNIVIRYQFRGTDGQSVGTVSVERSACQTAH